jgi:hypothetical protein
MAREKDAEKGGRVPRAPIAKQVLLESGVVITGGKRIPRVPLGKHGSLHKAGPGKATRRGPDKS